MGRRNLADAPLLQALHPVAENQRRQVDLRPQKHVVKDEPVLAGHVIFSSSPGKDDVEDEVVKHPPHWLHPCSFEEAVSVFVWPSCTI